VHSSFCALLPNSESAGSEALLFKLPVSFIRRVNPPYAPKSLFLRFWARSLSFGPFLFSWFPTLGVLRNSRHAPSITPDFLTFCQQTSINVNIKSTIWNCSIRTFLGGFHAALLHLRPFLGVCCLPLLSCLFLGPSRSCASRAPDSRQLPRVLVFFPNLRV